MFDRFSRRRSAKRRPVKPADWIVDQFLESHARRREACEEVRFETYLGAPDREDLAARAHSHRAEELRASVR
jgi:hypothetical protein